MAGRRTYTGEVYNKWTILEDAPDRIFESGQKKRYVVCKCSCGTIKEVNLSNLVRGKTISCGCELIAAGHKRRGVKLENYKPKKYVDLTGERFKKLLVLNKHIFTTDVARKTRSWDCLCDCGNKVTLPEHKLKSNISCGCYRKECHMTHGRSNHKSYRQYAAMKQRCYNPNNKKFRIYGGIGVTVCPRWMEKAPQGFLNFLEDMGERPKGMTLNRVHGNKVYSKDTCEWATAGEQSFDLRVAKVASSGCTGVILTKSEPTQQELVTKVK